MLWKRSSCGSIRSKSETGQFNEVLCKVICHNLACVVSAIYEPCIQVPQFSGQLPGWNR